MQTQVYIQTNPATGEGEIWLYRYDRDSDKQWYAKAADLEWIPTTEHEIHPEPTFRLDRRALQSLAEELPASGFTTKPDAEMAGELKATKDHLSDMRALVFETEPERRPR